MSEANTPQAAYPLTWPAGWPRTNYPTRSKFGARSIRDAYQTLQDELGRLRAGSVVISTNVPVLKTTSMPTSNQGQPPKDTGAAVYFVLNKLPTALACDRWDRLQDNLYAIAKHIDAIRGQARWGVGSLAQAFAGYRALPPSAESWWTVLGVPSIATKEEIEAAYRQLAKQHHPDQGGQHDVMAKINAARDLALEARG